MNEQFYEVLWGYLEVASRRSSLSRVTLYNLIADGLIRSRVIRRKNARGAGHRLVDLKSLDAFIENSPSDITDEVRARNRAAANMMQKVKNAKREQRDVRRTAREAKAA